LGCPRSAFLPLSCLNLSCPSTSTPRGPSCPIWPRLIPHLFPWDHQPNPAWPQCLRCSCPPLYLWAKPNIRHEFLGNAQARHARNAWNNQRTTAREGTATPTRTNMAVASKARADRCRTANWKETAQAGVRPCIPDSRRGSVPGGDRRPHTTTKIEGTSRETEGSWSCPRSCPPRHR